MAQFINIKYESSQINFDERKSGCYTSRKMRESMTNTNDNQLRLSKKYMKNANENIETLLQKMKEITEQQGYGNNSLTDYL